MPRMSKEERAARAARTRREMEYEETIVRRMTHALRWSEAVRPDVSPPDTLDALTTGWLFNTHTARVYPACSGVVSHGIEQTKETTSQGSRWLYSTKLRALMALRSELELLYARKLAEIDEQIARLLID